MLAVDVLRWPVDARRNGDLDQTQAVLGVLAVFQNTEPHWPGVDDFALATIDNFDGHARLTPCGDRVRVVRRMSRIMKARLERVNPSSQSVDRRILSQVRSDDGKTQA